ncbi:MAG: hypothetical protein U1V55_07700 [Planktothrix rubescens PR222]
MATKYTLPEGQKLATFKVDESDWEGFKTLCDSVGLSASKALTNFIKNSLDARELGAVAFAPVVESIQNIDIDIDVLTARVLEQVRSEIANTQPPAIDQNIEDRLANLESAQVGK